MIPTGLHACRPFPAVIEQGESRSPIPARTIAPHVPILGEQARRFLSQRDSHRARQPSHRARAVQNKAGYYPTLGAIEPTHRALMDDRREDAARLFDLHASSGGTFEWYAVEPVARRLEAQPSRAERSKMSLSITLDPSALVPQKPRLPKLLRGSQCFHVVIDDWVGGQGAAERTWRDSVDVILGELRGLKLRIILNE